MATTHGETLRLLVTQPACIDAVVDRLDELARETGDARVLSDLAAAFEVRAHQDDRPSDLLRSLDAAKRAVKANDKLPAAHYNLALAEEALGFSVDAVRTWKATGQLDGSPWANDAGKHQNALERLMSRNAATQWSLNRQRLPEVVAAGDHRAVADLVKPFPATIQRYLEEEVLPAWGHALANGRADEARQRLHEAEVIADQLSAVTGDPYTSEIVARITQAGRDEIRWLQDGHVVLAAARGFDRAYDVAQAKAAYATVAQTLRRAGSPLRLGAALGRAIQLYRLDPDKEEAKRKLEEIAAESRRRGYLNVWGRTEANLANILQIEGRYLESLDGYDVSIDIFRRMNDEESLTNAHIRKAAIYRVLGHEDAAMAESFLARRYSARLVEMPSRHLLAGETAAAVLALEFPGIALHYQTDFIDTLENEARNARGDENTTKAVRVNRAIALRGRAEIRAHLGQDEEARKDLEEAVSLAQGFVDDKIRNGLRARIAEARGETALQAKDYRAAIAAFTEAIELFGPVRYRTFYAILLARRAEAHRLLGDNAVAESDLRAAIDEVNLEEAELLAGRRRGQGEGLWTDYFSRFQETYFRLIGLLLAGGRKEEAFAYAEKSRAFEPLKLVLELPVADAALRSLDRKSVSPETLGAIRSALPVGTFLLEFQVGDDKTHVWIVSHDDFDVRTLDVGRKKIKEWSRGLQREAVTGDIPEFESQLSAPYDALLATPLEVLGKMKNGGMRERRLVIVADRYMHGFPFAALRDDRRRRHLVQDFTISVAASATLYVHALARDRKLAAAGGAPKALVIGDPAFDQTQELARGLDRLAAAKAEAINVGALYGASTPVLIDEQATVPAFLALSKHRDIIHLAGHAIVNRHAPFGTLLLMAPANGHNGLMYAEELLTKLELDRARLVVLAACSSAGGVPVGPEGLAPLVRPIVAAGVPGVVGSLWTISDYPSQRVLVEFHRHYREGNDAARALQLAQLHFLDERNPAIPVLAWAPFQVVGYASSPFPRNLSNDREANR